MLNLSQKVQIPTSFGQDVSPAFITLGHEFGHAYNTAIGLNNQKIYDPNNIDPILRKVTWDELSAMSFENKLRAYSKLPTRIAYTWDSFGNLFFPIP